MNTELMETSKSSLLVFKWQMEFKCETLTEVRVGFKLYIVMSRSVVDMLHHLIGKQIPSIPHCQTFSNDIDQRTNQLLQKHEAMLAFLR